MSLTTSGSSFSFNSFFSLTILFRYHRYHGESFKAKDEVDPAETRCTVSTDAGWTKADKSQLQEEREASQGGPPSNQRHFFCLHFSRGACNKGKRCEFFHRIPTQSDDASSEELHDCFGRQRHAKHKDDMSGVGSFSKPCRTLYVAGLMKSKVYEKRKKRENSHVQIHHIFHPSNLQFSFFLDLV